MNGFAFVPECPPDGVNLSGYPNLVYAPLQWGDRVVVIGSHRPAGDVSAAVVAGSSIPDVAAEFGCSIQAVRDSIRWVAAHPDA